MDPSPQRVLAERHLGRLHLRAHDQRAGALHLEQAFELAQTMTETLEHAPTLLAMAELRADETRLDEALALARHALERARPVEQIADVHVFLSRLYLMLGDQPSANRHAVEALAYALRLGSARLLSTAYLAAAGPAAARAKANTALETALGYAVSAGATFEHAQVLYAYAEHLERAGADLDRVAVMIAQAREIERNLGLFQVAPGRTLVV